MNYLWVLIYMTMKFVFSLKPGNVCQTDVCNKIAEELKIIINESVDPCDDFSSYVCGKFGKIYSIPPGKNRFNSHTRRRNDMRDELKLLLDNQELKNQNVSQTKAAVFYKSCVNIEKRNIETRPTLKKILNQITKDEKYEQNLIALLSTGITSRMVSVKLQKDYKNHTNILININQPKLILPTYILKSPDSNKRKLKTYKSYMKNVLQIIGFRNYSETFIDEIMELHVKLAKGFPSNTELKDPKKNMNKLTIKDLQLRCGKIMWKSFLNEIIKDSKKTLNDDDIISVFSLNYIDVLCSVLQDYLTNSTKLKILKMDLEWALIGSVTKLGSAKMMKANNKINKDIYGVVGTRKLWMDCVDLISETLPDIVGQMYAKNKLTLPIRKDVESMIQNIREIIKKNIEKSTWLDHETKSTALAKLNLMKFQIGYSEAQLKEIHNHSISMNIHRFLQNYIDVKRIQYNQLMTGSGEQTGDYQGMTGLHNVNAYYESTKNRFALTAGILGYPFYDIDLPHNLKYANIGRTIGHEIFHGFDNKGIEFDENGIKRDWWSKTSRTKFNEKTKCIRNQYGKYKIYNVSLLSGKTLRDDIADNSGLRVAYEAAFSNNEKQEEMTLPGLNLTSKQLFFVFQAKNRCSLVTKKAALEDLKEDSHSNWKYRINGPMSNMPEFSKHFKCDRKKAMNPFKKCIVW